MFEHIKALWCRVFGHRWRVERDLKKPPAVCDRCGMQGSFYHAE
jgi:hypothetical protein